MKVHLIWGLETDYWWKIDESTQWCVHQDRCVELSRGTSNAHCCHLLESSQWVTPGEELCHISLFQGAGDQHHHVVNHVAVAMATQRTEQMDVPLFVCLAFCIISHLLRTYFTTIMPSYSNNLIPCSLKADWADTMSLSRGESHLCDQLQKLMTVSGRSNYPQGTTPLITTFIHVGYMGFTARNWYNIHNNTFISV